jgi:hypothetical protein
LLAQEEKRPPAIPIRDGSIIAVPGHGGCALVSSLSTKQTSAARPATTFSRNPSPLWRPRRAVTGQVLGQGGERAAGVGEARREHDKGHGAGIPAGVASLTAFVLVVLSTSGGTPGSRKIRPSSEVIAPRPNSGIYQAREQDRAEDVGV